MTKEVLDVPAVLAQQPQQAVKQVAPVDPQSYSGTGLQETGYDVDAAGTALG